MIDVYYPYFKREAIWDELKYSVRSVCENLQEDFRLVIIGDRPDWLNDSKNCLYIPHQRCEGMRENTLFDAITKLEIYLHQKSRSDHFIRIYDDTYILRPVDHNFLSIPRALCLMNEIPNRSGVWFDQLRKTLLFVQNRFHNLKINRPVWNYETHFPECFKGDEMLSLVIKVEALKNRYLLSSMYWNLLNNQDPIIFDKSWAVQFYSDKEGKFYSSPDGDLNVKCAGKYFLNHNNTGLTENVKQFLMTRFPKKSMYEI